MREQEKPDLSIIVPAYGNATVLTATIETVAGYLSAAHRSFEIICIDDGSPTPIEFREPLPWLKVMRHKKNLGQQHAIATGLAAARGDIILTTDADLPVLPAEFMKLVAALEAEATLDLALGVRQGYTHRALVRAAGSRATRGIVRVIYSFDLQDFGCGTNAVRAGFAHRFLAAAIPRSPLKLAMLTLCSRFAEVALQTRQPQNHRSTYTLPRLILLVADILVFRLRAGRLRAPRTK